MFPRATGKRGIPAVEENEMIQVRAQWHSLSGLDEFGYTGGGLQALMERVRGLGLE